MRRICLTLFAIVSMNSVLLSGCPAQISQPQSEVDRSGAGGGGGY
jgi:hypothetical protein